MNKLHRKILIGDVLEKIKEIPDESIDVIISSPPYWGLRDYGAEGQWGLEKDFNEYLDKLDKLMDECKRVLKTTGTCWINLGDTYSTVSGGMKDLKAGRKKQYGKVNYTDKGKDNAYSVDQAKMYNKLQSKSRVGIPERFYIRCIDKGWIARNHIPWIKANSMPSSVKDRFTNKWESVFFFAKNQKYYFDLDAVRIKPKTEVKPKPFNRRIRDAKRLEEMNQQGAIVGAEMSEQEKMNTDKLGNKQDNTLGADGKPKANYKGFNARWQEKMNVTGTRIKISDIQETIVGETIDYDKSKPYAVQERAGILSYRELPPHNEIRLYLQEARKKQNFTIKQLEELFGKTCHHWFEDHTKPKSTPSFPSADDWAKLKKLLKFDDKYDIPMQTALYKRAEKQDNPDGKNPGDVFVDKEGLHGKTNKDGQPLSHHVINDRQNKLRAEGRDHDHALDHPNGKNPGDTFKEEVVRLESEMYGKGDMQNARRSRVLAFLNTTGRKENCNPNGKNPGDIFEINTKPFPKAHFATFPPSLPERIIKCSCPKDGIILDPFFGAGTVAVVAEELHREWVGIELKQDYTEIARERLKPYLEKSRLETWT